MVGDELHLRLGSDPARTPVGARTADPAAAHRKRELLTGDVPSPANPPSACRFHTRCPKAQQICSQDEPPLEEKGSGTRTACHFPLTEAEVKLQLPNALVSTRSASS